jgi:mannose-P-dolichol utilization defect protein 1
MYFMGSLARVFTTVQEVNDPLLLWGYGLATALNGVLVLQMIMYWNVTSKKSSGKKVKRK